MATSVLSITKICAHSQRVMTKKYTQCRLQVPIERHRLAGRGCCVLCFVMQMSNRHRSLATPTRWRFQSHGVKVCCILVGFSAVYSIAVLVIFCCEICKKDGNSKINFKGNKKRKKMRMKQWLTLTPERVTSAPWCSLQCPAIGKHVLANSMCERSCPLPPQGICTFLILSAMIHAGARSTCV